MRILKVWNKIRIVINHLKVSNNYLEKQVIKERGKNDKLGKVHFQELKIKEIDYKKGFEKQRKDFDKKVIEIEERFENKKNKLEIKVENKILYLETLEQQLKDERNVVLGLSNQQRQANQRIEKLIQDSINSNTYALKALLNDTAIFMKTEDSQGKVIDIRRKLAKVK